MLSKTSARKETPRGVSGNKKTISGPAAVFFTIDPQLEDVALNSPLSPKAAAAKKMFEAAKH